MGSGKAAALAGVGLLLAAPIAIAMIGGDDNGSDTGSTLTTNSTLSDAVPAEYAAFVQAAGQVCPEITPSLIAAQIETESGWNPKAASPAGAQGISQFIPSTWAANGIDANNDGKADINDPADAIATQAHLMCNNVAQIRAWINASKVSGDPVDLALAAYNAGAGAILQFGGVPPYPETVSYVEKIHAKQAKYVGTMTGGRDDVIQWAKSQYGKPYRGEGAGPGCGSFGPSCWDCCGLVFGAYKAVGVTLPMSTPGNPWATAKCEYAVYTRYGEYGGQRIQIAPGYTNLLPGDILFYQDGDPAIDNVTHVALFLGGDQLIDATPGHVVGARKIYKSGLLPYAVRIAKK